MEQDNELAILKQIQNFRWAEFFTYEKHENELQIEKNKKNKIFKRKK